jgi:heat shock protein HtpX
MLTTLFLLGLLYVVFIGVLFAAGAGAGIIVVVALLLLLLQLFASDKIAMATLGVKEVSPAEEPELHGIIERLCVQADLPKPRVCVMETSMPNAFAMGRTRKSTTVCATRGILELLSPPELEGVLAHEITHVINRDVMVMTLAGFFASLAALILQFAFFFGGGGNSEEGEEDIFIVVIASMIVYAFSFLLMRALSRYRGSVERVLHRARAGEEVADEPLRRPPAARAAPCGARAAGVPASERRLTWGCATSSRVATR